MRARARRNASGVPSIGFHPSATEDEELDEAAFHINQHYQQQQQQQQQQQHDSNDDAARRQHEHASSLHATAQRLTPFALYLLGLETMDQLAHADVLQSEYDRVLLQLQLEYVQTRITRYQVRAMAMAMGSNGWVAGVEMWKD